MKKCPIWFLVCVLFASPITLSYAQEGTLTFPSPWGSSRPGSESVFFGPWADGTDSGENMAGLLGFEMFPNNGNNSFGFDGFFDGFLDQPVGQETELLSPFNVFETNGLIMVQTSVEPGIALEDIGIAVEGNVLSINVADTQMTEESGEDYNRIEWHRASITRTIPLPAEVSPDEMTTDYEDGELTVTLPKEE